MVRQQRTTYADAQKKKRQNVLRLQLRRCGVVGSVCRYPRPWEFFFSILSLIIIQLNKNLVLGGGIFLRILFFGVDWIHIHTHLLSIVFKHTHLYGPSFFLFPCFVFFLYSSSGGGWMNTTHDVDRFLPESLPIIFFPARIQRHEKNCSSAFERAKKKPPQLVYSVTTRSRL